MAYKPVSRVVTVEFVKEKRGKGYEVRLTPECIVARYRDKIVWDIQGLPAGLAGLVSFGGFEPRGPLARVSRVARGLVPHANRGFTTRVAGVGANLRATIDTDGAELGRYKYSVFFDGEPLIDPEGEVKGPRN